MGTLWARSTDLIDRRQTVWQFQKRLEPWWQRNCSTVAAWVPRLTRRVCDRLTDVRVCSGRGVCVSCESVKDCVTTQLFLSRRSVSLGRYRLRVPMNVRTTASLRGRTERGPATSSVDCVVASTTRAVPCGNRIYAVPPSRTSSSYPVLDGHAAHQSRYVASVGEGSVVVRRCVQPI